MSFSRYFEETLKELFTGLHSESSPAFQQSLKEAQIEKEKVKVPFYHCNLDNFLNIKEAKLISKYYSFVDKELLEKVKKIIKPQKAASDISSILKRTYYKVLIAKLDIEPRKRISTFFKSFSDFCLFYTEEFLEVNFLTDKKRITFKSKNKDFISVVKKTLGNAFGEKPFGELLPDFSITDEFLNTPDISGMYIELAAMEILHYLQAKGLSPKSNLNSHYLNKYSNFDLKTTYQLLEIANLIDENGKINSTEKDYLRTRLKRYNSKMNPAQYKTQTIKAVKKLGVKKGDDLSLLLERFISKALEKK